MILSSPERPSRPLRMSEDEDEDMICATPKQPSPNPKRTRQLVTKHYMDKDGFMGNFKPTSHHATSYSLIFNCSYEKGIRNV